MVTWLILISCILDFNIIFSTHTSFWDKQIDRHPHILLWNKLLIETCFLGRSASINNANCLNSIGYFTCKRIKNRNFVCFYVSYMFDISYIRYNYLNDLPSLDPELYRHLIFLKVTFLAHGIVASCFVSYGILWCFCFGRWVEWNKLVHLWIFCYVW